MRRTLIIMIGLIVVLTIAAVILTIINGRNTTNSNSNQTNTNSVVPLDTNTSTNSSQITPPSDSAQSAVVSLARSFAERYGSWTPAALPETFTELTPWLTRSFAGTFRTVHESATASPTLLSVASQALSSSVKEWEAGSRATIEVVLNRTEQRKNEPTVKYYESLTLSLVFQNGNWLIDKAVWSPSRIQPGGSGG